MHDEAIKGLEAVCEEPRQGRIIPGVEYAV